MNQNFESGYLFHKYPDVQKSIQLLDCVLIQVSRVLPVEYGPNGEINTNNLIFPLKCKFDLPKAQVFGINPDSSQFDQKPSLIDIKFIESNKCYEYTLSPTSPFTPSDSFTPSNQFTRSDSFTASQSFTASNPFTASNTFLPPLASHTFSPSSKFTPSKEFTPSNKFTPSDTFWPPQTPSPTASASRTPKATVNANLVMEITLPIAVLVICGPIFAYFIVQYCKDRMDEELFNLSYRKAANEYVSSSDESTSSRSKAELTEDENWDDGQTQDDFLLDSPLDASVYLH